jgi:hypothetical protein
MSRKRHHVRAMFIGLKSIDYFAGTGYEQARRPNWLSFLRLTVVHGPDNPASLGVKLVAPCNGMKRLISEYGYELHGGGSAKFGIEKDFARGALNERQGTAKRVSLRQSESTSSSRPRF